MIILLFIGLIAIAFGVLCYVFQSLGMYAIAKRRGIRKPWLAWVPVVNVWLLGSLSDQYQYVVRGETKSKRKWLLVLNIVKSLLILAVVILAGVMVVGMFFQGPGPGMKKAVATPLMGILGTALPLAAVTIAACVIRYMALYDVFRSMDPANAVLYLILSIFFSPTEPFFLFFNREKDLGMPPRKQRPVQEPVPEQDYEYVTVEDTEYL